MDQMPDKIFKAYIETLRRMTPEQKLEKIFEMAELARGLFFAGQKELHPEFTPEQLKRAYLKNLEKCYNRNY